MAHLRRLSRLPETAPYWARQGQHRFDDPQGLVAGAPAFGVLYAAQDVETAFCESVLHENSLFTRGRFQTPRATLVGRKLVGFKHASRRSLRFADLSGQGLKSLGRNNDISAGDDYSVRQQWAGAIHRAHPEIDGVRHVSRQNNDTHCFAVFERSGLQNDGWAALSHADLRWLCRRFNVRVIA